MLSKNKEHPEFDFTYVTKCNSILKIIPFWAGFENQNQVGDFSLVKTRTDSYYYPPDFIIHEI